MPDKAWKAWERTVAKDWGGKRRGAYTGDSQHGKTDIIKEGWAIECKLLSRPSFVHLQQAVEQAKTNAEKSTDIPVAVIRKKGQNKKKALVVMAYDEFIDLFVNREPDEKEETD